MSIFGNLGQTQNTFSSGQTLSGNLGSTTSSQTGPSLFGTTVSTSQATPSLFSGLGGASKPQSTPSLFANLGSSQSQQQQPQPSTSGGLFPGLGGSTPQAQPSQPTSGGLFGGLGTTTSQPQQSTSGGLFPGLGAASSQPQQAAGGGLFPGLGTSTSQPTNQPGTSSLFGGATNAPSQGQFQQGQNQQNGQTTQTAYFDHLLERGKKRHNQQNRTSQLSDLPSLQLGLGDIARKVRNLGTGGPTAQQARAGDSRAHYLLAASGVSTASALKDLNAFSGQAAATPAIPSTNVLDTDIDGYISNLHAQSTLDLIAEGLEQSKRDFDTFLEENVQMEWDAQRRRIYEHFGLARQSDNADGTANGSSSIAARGAFGRSTRKGRAFGASASTGAAMSFGASGMTRSVIGNPNTRSSGRSGVFADTPDVVPTDNLRSAPDSHFVREKQEKFAEKVKQLNSVRLQEKTYPVLHEFAEVESQGGVDNSAHLVDAYRALIEITGEKPKVQERSDPEVVKERQYAEEYLEETPTSGKSIAMRKRILDGSRRYLEKQFLGQIENAIARNPKEANLGGIPTAINKVRAYIRLLSARKELGAENDQLQKLEGDYCWVLIFYLLRSGLVREAAQYVVDNERAIKIMDRNFPQYITSYASSDDRRLHPDLQTRIASEYNQRARIAPEGQVDPYRMACYKIIGRCELTRRNLDGINHSMEDWLWLQFALAREVNRTLDSAGEAFDLDELRNTVASIGQRHFAQGAENGGGVGTFFFLQVSAGMFENAVSYLYSHNQVSAVHFAIALSYYGLLRVSDYSSSADLLSYNTKGLPQISFGPLVGYYTRDFRSAKPEAAADYLILICLNADLPGQAGRQQAELCHEALRELVLETREFTQLLGDVRTDGYRIPGAIEQRMKLIGLADQEHFLRTVTMQAASVADDAGRITDAVLLYHLAEEYDNVTTIVNRALSDALSVDLGQERLRLEPPKPRVSEKAGPPQQRQRLQGQPESSLSLTSVDDPAVLAKNIISVYNANATYFRKIKQSNRDACGLLLQMSEARDKTEAGRWAEALDIIIAMNLLPTSAHSNISLIRAAAQNFNTLPPVVARNIGNLLVWTVTCCGRQRDVLLSSVFEDRTRKQMADELLIIAKDLMVFAGLVRYKLPPRVFELLASVGQDVGA